MFTFSANIYLPYSILFQTLPLPAKVKKKTLCYEKYKIPVIIILVHG